MRLSIRAILVSILAAPLAAQRTVTFEERPGLMLENDKLELITLPQGGAFVSLRTQTAFFE